MYLLENEIRKSHIDTDATTSHTSSLSLHIDKIIMELNSNIFKLNEKVKALVEEPAAWGNTMTHLLNDLFEDYKVASEK